VTRSRELPVPLARALKGAVEIGVVSTAFVLAYLLRFDLQPDADDWQILRQALPIAIIATFILILAFMLPVVMIIVSPLKRCADGEYSGQRSEKYPR